MREPRPVRRAGRGRWAAAALVVVGIVTASGCSAGTAGGAGDGTDTDTAVTQLTVTSTDFADGEAIPDRFTCDGAGEFPGISWTGDVDEAAAFAVVVDDPDAPGSAYTHLVVLDLPPGAMSLDSVTEVADGATVALNASGGVGWTPPCPPSGEHRYRFTVYALSSPTGLGADATPAQADEAIRSRLLGEGTLVGLVAA